jgi:hypothetical protein
MRACWLIVVALLSGIGAAQPDLPPADAFLREAREVFTRSQEVWHHYAYTERSTELHINPFGRMGTGGVNLYDVRPAANPRLTYRRLMSRDGVPLSADELRRQDAEYEARAARLTQSSADESARRRNDDLLARKRAQMMVDDVVNTMQFDLARREMRDGVPVIIVTFAAKPDARPMTREGRLASVFRGELSIDEASREITDVKAVALRSVSFGGFIAKVYEGTEVTVMRREVDRGVWMPTKLTLTGNFRALFRTARIDHVVEWFDYRRIP